MNFGMAIAKRKATTPVMVCTEIIHPSYYGDAYGEAPIVDAVWVLIGGQPNHRGADPAKIAGFPICRVRVVMVILPSLTMVTG